MAEIKSTLDIIMEKTRHLVLSPEEKQQLELDEHLRKVPGYLQKFYDDVLSLDGLLELIAALPNDVRQPVTQEIVKQLLRTLDFDAKGRKNLRALEQLAPTEQQAKVIEIGHLLDRFEATYQELVARRRGQLRAELAALGIAGSAVVIPEEASDQWELKRQEYLDRLHLLKSTC